MDIHPTEPADDQGPMLEIGTALADMVQVLERPGPETALLAIGAALADVVQLLERSGHQSTKGIIEAINAISLQIPEAQPTPAPPVVSPQGWEFSVEYGGNGEIKRMRAVPIAAKVGA